jgi:hypothetical protein
MLAGATAGLNGIPRSAGEQPLEHGTDRLMIAMEGWRVEPPIGFKAAAILAEFNDVASHTSLPELPQLATSL